MKINNTDPNRRRIDFVKEADRIVAAHGFAPHNTDDFVVAILSAKNKKRTRQGSFARCKAALAVAAAGLLLLVFAVIGFM